MQFLQGIRDHIIKTMTNNVVRIKAIRKNWTLDQILEEAELDEETPKTKKWRRKSNQTRQSNEYKIIDDKDSDQVYHRPMEKQQFLLTVVDMTVHTNSVQPWDLFVTHVANVTTMLAYVDRSLQKDLRATGDKDNSKVKTKETHHNQHREKESER